jgi:hypothetical protein
MNPRTSAMGMLAAIASLGGIDMPQVRSTERFDPINGRICGWDAGGKKGVLSGKNRNERCLCGKKRKKCDCDNK